MASAVEIGGLRLVVGNEYIRRELHLELGGSVQGGISPSRQQPVVMLFSGPAGSEHGYGFDGWKSSTVYEYTGEGQPNRGNQQFQRGNKAIRDHEHNGKRLLVFEKVMDGKRTTNRVRFEGEFRYIGHRIETRDTAGNAREVIVFLLSPVEQST